ncbi:hypothetical protein BDR26DRAFT_1002677 [Obelidium mucronatum]|nr:hypothetical protein BDR26DRAFT_1002677 [Obelidium mucronatum]
MSTAALEHKNRGNEHYKKREFALAIDCYSAAVALEPACAAFRGNRSAALFELGRYAEAAADAAAARGLCGTGDDALAARLDARVLSCAAFLCDVVPSHTASHVASSHSDAFLRQTLIAVPSYEYFPIGHDKAVSLLVAGEGDAKTNAVALSELADFSVLLGGAGDGRHMFATLSDVWNQFKNQPSHNDAVLASNIKMRFVLNDLNPTVAARHILLLTFISQLSAFPEYNRQENPDLVVLISTVTYLFAGVVMPKAHFDAVYAVISEYNSNLEDTLASKLPFVSITNESTRIAVQRVFHLWHSKIKTISRKKILASYKVQNLDPSLMEELTGKGNMSEMNAEFVDMQKQRQDQLKDMVNMFTDEQIMEMIPGPGSVASKKEMIGKMMAETSPLDTTLDTNPLLIGDKLFMQKSKTLLPPIDYPGLEDSIKSEISNIRVDFSKAKVTRPRPYDMPVLKKFVHEYLPNPAMIDFDFVELMGHIELSYDLLDVAENLNGLDVPKEANDVFDCFGRLFFNSAHCFKEMNVGVELCAGDIHSLGLELTRKNSVAAGMDEQSVPQLFDCILMSNIPDYTGLLNGLLIMSPLLKKTATTTKNPAILRANVLFNTGIWKNYDHYVFSSTLLNDASETLHLLGAKVIRGGLWGDDPCWTFATPTLATDINSREQLIQWLHRLVLAISYPAPRDVRQAFFENSPLTLNTFLLAIETVSKHVPLHWISGFLQELMFSTKPIVAPISVPEFSPNKVVPNLKPRVLHVAPFRQELQALVSLWSISSSSTCFSRLPLPQLPKDVVCVQTPPMDRTYPAAYVPKSMSAALGLLILPQTLADTVQYSRAGPIQGLYASIVIKQSKDCHLFTAVQRVEGSEKEDEVALRLSFVASKAFIEGLKKEEGSRHVVIAIRTDSWEILSRPVQVSALNVV